LNPHDVVRALLRERADRAPRERGEAYAPANIALCKYWGKRDAGLNLPITSSLSVSLGDLGARTRIEPLDGPDDRFVLNGREAEPNGSAARRVGAFLDRFRGADGPRYFVESESRIPVGAGLASSASGFAALVKALDRLYGWDLPPESLSILARLGSGSACRSVYDGFVVWEAGERADGMDSLARRMDEEWPDLRIGLHIVSSAPKPVGSREGMNRTVETSLLYRVWPERVAADLPRLRDAIRDRDFEALGATAESNALTMHATMMDARPPILYWKPETVGAMERIRALRAAGVAAYYTIDAGPNVKILYEESSENAIREAFPELQIAIPFAQ
jgi:diphosphomevalonate decarboxylase